MTHRFVSLALLGALASASVAAQAADRHPPTQRATAAASYPCDNSQFEQDQQDFQSGYITADQFEDICGTVTSVLPAKKTRSGNHGYFYVQLNTGETIEIVANLDEMNVPAWPWVAQGDSTYVQGRYYYDNDDSQGIDWTHHGSSSSWPHEGYVVVNGTKYQ